MMVYEDGSRVPFDPLRMGRHLAGCLLCGQRIAAVGIFIPRTDAMRAAVMRLREHPVPPQSTACLSYGLCRHHLAQRDAIDLVEVSIAAAAAKVPVQ